MRDLNFSESMIQDEFNDDVNRILDKTVNVILS
jgi:hypothetical protein